MVEDKVIDDCPRYDCNGQIKRLYQLFGFCEKCYYPVFLCENCKTFNRSFARFCRECGKSVSFPETSLSKFQFTRSKFEQISRNFSLEESIFETPKVSKGLLWFLTESGKVYAISPYARNPFSIGSLGTEFSNSPFLITELTTNGTTGIPHLISISPHLVRGLNLITMEHKDFISLGSSEEIICDRGKIFCSIAESNGKLYFLKRKTPNETSCFCLLDLANNNLISFDLDEKDVSGPIKVGKSIVAYSKNKFYLISEKNEVKINNFRPGFSPCLSNNDFQEFYPAHGLSPYTAKGETFYLQGFSHNKPGFLCIDFSVPTMSQAFVTLHAGSGTYGPTTFGNPIIATEERILELKESALIEIQRDDQITCQNVPFYAAPLAVAFAQGSGGRKLIRFFYQPSNMISEYNIGELRDFSTAIGFFLFSGSLVLVYGRENKNIGVAIWDL